VNQRHRALMPAMAVHQALTQRGQANSGGSDDGDRQDAVVRHSQAEAARG